MKANLFFALLLVLGACATTKSQQNTISGVYPVSCGKCNFDMTGDECELAIEIEGKRYYVEGSDIHDHGNPDAEGGMCTKVRKAEVTGQLKFGVFRAESFTLLPE
jgi:hypothetical protein